jgi:hypothetical protein
MTKVATPTTAVSKKRLTTTSACKTPVTVALLSTRLSVYLKRIRNANMQNQPTFSQNVGFFIKSSQSRKTDFHWLLHPELFRPGFRHIVQAWQIPRDCRVCLALAPVKHKVWPLVG